MKLSPREAQAAALVAQGLMNKEIAFEMGIAERTVKIMLHSVFVKRGVRNRVELASSEMAIDAGRRQMGAGK